jgi:spermidine synthase
VIGDGRISLENQLEKEPMQFDVIIADAFSGDAIPVHLITKEAIALYLRHLKPDGILVFQTTNRYIDLKPVLYRMSVEFKKIVFRIVQQKDNDEGLKHAEHVILTSNQAFINDEHVVADLSEWPTDTRKDILWTDDYSTIAPLLKE